MDRRVIRSSFLLALVLAVALSLWTVGPAEAQRKDGDVVKVSGQILDDEGVPVSGVSVLLEATRTTYSWLKRKKETEPPLQQIGQVDAEGRFEIPWSWHRRYNAFALTVAMEVTRGGQPDYEILHRQDLTTEMTGGAPVHVFITLKEAGYVRWLESYIAGQATEDEEQVFGDNGRPDRIKVDDRESSWWYFTAGKVIRFRDGKLDQVIHFDPMDSVPPE